MAQMSSNNISVEPKVRNLCTSVSSAVKRTVVRGTADYAVNALAGAIIHRLCGDKFYRRSFVMKARQLLNLLGAVFVLFAAIGCATSGGSTPAPDARETETDLFTDEQGSLKVFNETGFDAVLFAGRPELGNILGGVRAHSSRAFDLRKIAGAPAQGAFIVKAVSAETHTLKQADISSNDVLYTALVVYDLQNPSQTAQVNIPQQVDGNMTFSVLASNDSGMILEIHADSPSGPKLAALPPFARNMTLWLVPSPGGLPYELFGVFIAVNPASGEAAVIGQSEDGQLRGQRCIPVQAGAGRDMMFLNFDSREKPEFPVSLLFE
jgi:hypothetical protein